MVSNSSARSPRRADVRAAAAGGRETDGRDAGSRGEAVADAARRAKPATETEQLLRRYRLRRSRAVLDQIVERYRGLVEAMALSLAARLPRSVDAKDLEHAGMWGMMQAIGAFQPDRCDRFEAFLRIRVRGAMLDELRHMDFLPRLFRRRVRERDAARARLRMQLEREPTNSELAAALGISDAALLRCPDSSVLRSVHRHDVEADEEHEEQFADDAVVSPVELATRQELLDLVRRSLQPVEWKVLQLHYLEGLTGKQVARRLRLSASRICQIHGRVLDRLKQQLTEAATA